MKKLTTLILIGILIALLFALVKNKTSSKDNQEIIGGDKDNGDCLIAAGYSWCERKQMCLRPWEESCEEIKNPKTPQDILKNTDTPQGWKIEMESGKPEGCISKTITSSDFKMSEGYPVLEKGSQITTKICETKYTSAKEFFSSNTLRTTLAKNINEITLGRIPAIQYDYDYEGTVATETMFLFNEEEYSVRLRYPSLNDKQMYWDIYSSTLDKIQHNLLDSEVTLD